MNVISIYCVFFLFLFIPESLVQHAHTRTEEVWLLENYKPAEGKIIGIWPHDDRLNSAEQVQKLNNKFGFNYILLPSALGRLKFQLLLDNGFPRDKIMAQILPYNFIDRIKSYGSIYAYYLDEPNERDYSVTGIKEEVGNSRSLLIISGYRRTSNLAALVSQSDGVMFSSYKHWWQCFPGVWCAWPENQDQRDDWSDMKERYGTKSFMNWTGAHRDTLEYSDLIKHSADLELKGIWLYQYEERTNSEANILSFCHSAWVNGYLRKFERKHVLQYRCSKSSLEDCEQSDWVLVNQKSTAELRETFSNK